MIKNWIWPLLGNVCFPTWHCFQARPSSLPVAVLDIHLLLLYNKCLKLQNFRLSSVHMVLFEARKVAKEKIFWEISNMSVKCAILSGRGGKNVFQAIRCIEFCTFPAKYTPWLCCRKSSHSKMQKKYNRKTSLLGICHLQRFSFTFAMQHFWLINYSSDKNVVLPVPFYCIKGENCYPKYAAGWHKNRFSKRKFSNAG